MDNPPQVPQAGLECAPDQAHIERKTLSITRDFDTTPKWHANIESEIAGWRSMTVTLLLAYIGYLSNNLSGKSPTDSRMISIILIIPLPFFFLEIFRRATLAFLGEEIRDIARIFMITNNNTFALEVERFVLRDVRLRPENLRKEIRQRLKYILLGFADFSALVWYTGIMICAFLANISFQARSSHQFDIHCT